MALMRSGWLWRQTSVLKRWKLNWCDLWVDGSFCFYKSDSRRELVHRVNLKLTCADVRCGLECQGVTPPETNPRENIIVVQFKDSSTMNLCANSEDESIAWKLTMLETRRNPVFMYDPYNDSYEAIPLNHFHTFYMTPGAGTGTHQLIVQRDGAFDHLAMGLLAGIATGAAMRSFLWAPMFFC
ncbi:pleckstrin homology domain-containing family B member 1 isoform X2 [Syngnathus scovelli]|uniref:pleckstrin homology domain-containing family B member 1 isoform X2 n=1 Tax=Syngnathus scovelli TaxID=161590 RepID=UPI002110793D|nr:pleckstrin homology domain-containing family B member 1 isoform X2 [Syngnathus scovelli]